jgi:hypothetical protein
MSPPATPGAVWLGAATLALVLHAAGFWLLARSADDAPQRPPRIDIERVAVERERAAARADTAGSTVPPAEVPPADAPSAPAASAQAARASRPSDAVATSAAPATPAAPAERVQAEAATPASGARAVAARAPSAPAASGPSRRGRAMRANPPSAAAEAAATTTAPTATAGPTTAARVDAGAAPAPTAATAAAASAGKAAAASAGKAAAASAGEAAASIATARAADRSGRARDGTVVAGADRVAATAAEPVTGDAPAVVTADPASAGARSSRAPATRAGRPSTSAPVAAAVRPETVVADVVADLECADVTVEDGPHGRRVVGVVDSAEARARLAREVRRALSSAPVTVDLDVHVPPFCAVVAPLADDGGVAIALDRRDAVYRAGDLLVFDVTVEAPAGGYLYVDFVDPTGTVFHLLPRPGEPPPAVQPGEIRRIGGDFWEVSRGGDGFVVEPPFGRGLVVARVLAAAAERWSPPAGEQAVARFATAAAAAGDVRAAGWRYVETRPAR